MDDLYTFSDSIRFIIEYRKISKIFQKCILFLQTIYTTKGRD